MDQNELVWIDCGTSDEVDFQIVFIDHSLVEREPIKVKNPPVPVKRGDIILPIDEIRELQSRHSQ